MTSPSPDLTPRVQALEKHLNLSTVDLKREWVDNVVVIIPTYTAARSEQIDVAISSILHQAAILSSTLITIVIADNGLSLEDKNALRRRTEDAIQNQDVKVTLEIVDAHPSGVRSEAPGYQRTAAYARNKAIDYIIRAAKSDPKYRGDIFLLDDDAALVGPSLPILHKALWDHPNRVAVVPTFIPTSDLSADWNALNQRHRTSPDLTHAVRKTRDLPQQFRGNEFDLGPVLAFSGDISTKTAALGISRTVINRLHSSHNMIFKVYPNGSFEDMAFGAVVSRQGLIAHNPAARCLDLVRQDPSSMMRQKVQWGRDHVQALSDFIDLGHFSDGIKVLEPITSTEDDPYWVQWSMPSKHRGVVINPRQLLDTVFPTLRRQIERGVYDELGGDFAKDALSRELVAAARIVHEIVNQPPRDFSARYDLGAPDLNAGLSGTRFAPEVSAYQLAGNLVGSRDVSTLDEMRFVFGVRQKSIRRCSAASRSE
jgi:hypothetical protein